MGGRGIVKFTVREANQVAFLRSGDPKISFIYQCTKWKMIPVDDLNLTINGSAESLPLTYAITAESIRKAPILLTPTRSCRGASR